MKLAQYKRKNSGRSLGLGLGNKIVDVPALAQAVRDTGEEVKEWLLNARTTLDVISVGDGAVAAINALIEAAHAPGLDQDERFSSSFDEVEFLPAVDAGKILAIGRNYVDHAIEGGAAPPESPLIFNKLINSLSAHNKSIVLPTISKKVDYEAELGVIIGRKAKGVSEADALKYVFGYAPINDVSARDLQFGDGQWVRGKGLDTFAPIGPFLTTSDEVADVQALNIEGRLNGQVMQSSNTAKMIFNVAYLISYLSQGITLEPGDVIATGTPEGVGVFRDPPVLLKAGDVYEVTIEGLGTLSNPVTGPE
ncbi:MAG TPA: fumarylacetoacetate hydrolase family protein [Pyrinomonadaceae bacterium]|jgi:2-keto-4-pentenoate hydratase/2-oxohepta-3-ene-1,7-dioic acid hydratase in catechol pathway|nr:fumarylacetoacetate hydrolase family protein [Pyrinomonadaceae bacterium]